LPKQVSVCKVVESPTEIYRPILTKRFNGFLLLNKIKDGDCEFFDEEEKKENKNSEEAKENNNSQQGNSGAYQPVPTSDVEMPEEIDLNDLNKK